MVCAQWRNLTWTREVVGFIADKLDMVGQFSLSGCKKVESHVNTEVLGVIEKMNRQTRVCGVGGWFMCFTHSEHTLHLSVEAGAKIVVKSSSDRQ